MYKIIWEKKALKSLKRIQIIGVVYLSDSATKHNLITDQLSATFTQYPGSSIENPR
jgi:hypothetical protein